MLDIPGFFLFFFFSVEASLTEGAREAVKAVKGRLTDKFQIGLGWQLTLIYTWNTWRVFVGVRGWCCIAGLAQLCKHRGSVQHPDSCPCCHTCFCSVCGHVLPSLGLGPSQLRPPACFWSFTWSLTWWMKILNATEQDTPLQELSGNVCSQSEDRLLGHLFASSWKPHFPHFSSLKSRYPASTTSCFPTHPVKEEN